MKRQTLTAWARAARFLAPALLVALSACGGSRIASTGAMSEQLARCRAEAAPIYQAASFDDYLNRVRATARRCGIRSSAIAALSGLERRASYDIDRFPAGLYPQVAALPQEDLREFKPNPTRKYVEQRIERLSEQGRELLDRHRALLKRVEARYGVPAEYIVAFWGIETNYGGFVGEHDVVETLANLGHSSSRRRFFTEELLAALILLDRGHVRRGFKGSYAGAFGQAQFMPTSYIQNAVDFDGDGRADLYGSLPDVFASIANYEVQRGRWDGKVGTALAEVRLPRDFPHAEADIENRREAGYWASLGVKRADGEPLSDHLGPAAILLPAGCKGPAFLATQNFFAVMDYNPLVDYAMAVSLLAETLRHGEYRLAQAWPDEEPLSAGDRARLQELLARRGHGDLAIDGRIGRESRAAIRRAQAALGQCADGYATATLLYALDQQDKPAIRIARDEPKQRRGWFPAQAGTRKAQTRKKRGG